MNKQKTSIAIALGGLALLANSSFACDDGRWRFGCIAQSDNDNPVETLKTTGFVPFNDPKKWNKKEINPRDSWRLRGPVNVDQLKKELKPGGPPCLTTKKPLSPDMMCYKV
ncbi:MAG: hypothetical protein H6868_09640 [Rhodospirillales bacterium]|nr:hypothetical protein [Rhodospirillales bacterium]